jgi:hypothetical protein
MKDFNLEMVRKIGEDELQTLFKPQIGRGPNDGHKHVTTSVHEHLYNYKDIYKTKQELNREIQHKGDRKASGKTSNNSDSILESSLYEKFTKLFNLIDTDENG